MSKTKRALLKILPEIYFEGSEFEGLTVRSVESDNALGHISRTASGSWGYWRTGTPEGCSNARFISLDEAKAFAMAVQWESTLQSVIWSHQEFNEGYQ